MYYKTVYCLDFPSGPVAQILRSQCRGPWLDQFPGQGPRSQDAATKSLHAATKVSHAVTKTENLQCHN